MAEIQIISAVPRRESTTSWRSQEGLLSGQESVSPIKAKPLCIGSVSGSTSSRKNPQNEGETIKGCRSQQIHLRANIGLE